MIQIIIVPYVKTIYSFIAIKPKPMVVFLEHVILPVKEMVVTNQIPMSPKVCPRCAHAFQIAKHVKMLNYVTFADLLGYYLPKEQVVINRVITV